MKPLFLFGFLLCTTAHFAQNNLVKNGGFESETLNWNGDVGTLSPYDKKSGKNSVVINQFVGADWKALDQKVSVPKNTYAIEFSAWIKSESIAKGKESYNAGLFIVDFNNSADKKISGENIATVSGTSQWTYYKKTFLVPEKTSNIRIMLALAQTSGSIYFDDVKATTLTQEEYQKANATPLAQFSNGNFEQNLSPWNGSAELSTDKKEGNTAVKISSSNNQWVAIDQQAGIPEKAQSVTITGWLKAENIVQGKQNWNNGMFIIEFTNSLKAKTTEDQLIGMISNSTEWTFFSKKFTIPKESTTFRLMLALSECTGTLLADDIQVYFDSQP